MAPLPKPDLKPNKWTIHLIDSDDLETPDQIRERILRDYDQLLPYMKRGDAVDNYRGLGIRSSGAFFVDHVDVTNPSSLRIVDRAYELEEYGSQPLHFTTPDVFPPNYFDEDAFQVNGMYFPTKEASSYYFYWHSNDAINIVSRAFLDQEVQNRTQRNVDKYTLYTGAANCRGTQYQFEWSDRDYLDDFPYVRMSFHNGQFSGQFSFWEYGV